MDIIENLKKIVFEAAVENGLKISKDEIKFEHPVDNKFGDYSTNVAMIFAKKQNKNPKELANLICQASKLTENQLIEKVEVAGAGFINFYMKAEYLINEAEKINYQIEFRNRLSKYGKGKTMVIDYSSPNIAKPFGIGHLRSTNIGQSIYNIFKILGWNCIGDNHLGDWGTQYGKLVAAIKKWNKKDLNELKIEDLEKLYIRFHKEAETDDSLIVEGRNWFAKLENGDEEALKIWQKCVDISILEFERIYRVLGVKIDFIHGESFYEKMLPAVIKEIISKGITKKSEGAIIVEFDSTAVLPTGSQEFLTNGLPKQTIMPPAMLQKSNETTTYFSRDMAAVKYRLETWKPDLIIYEVGIDQQLHFKQVFKTVELMGWAPQTKFIYIGHGLIRWPSGKFSTRKGETIHLSEVIEKATNEAKKIAKNTIVNKNLTASEKEEMVRKVAIGAVKFSDLASDPKKDVIFNWNKVMSLDGDSGPYLQYTYARCKSVLSKSQIKETKNINEIPKEININEMNLLKEFYKLEEKIIEASERFSPSVIADYLLGVARKYNEFYAKNRILNKKDEVFRLFLSQTTASVIKVGLSLLGIDTIEKM